MTTAADTREYRPVSFKLTGPGPAPDQGQARKRDTAWLRLAPGLYQTGDGRYRVHNPLAGVRRSRTWYLAEADETSPAGWQASGVYRSKAAAQAAAPAPYAVPLRESNRTGADVRANPTNRNGDYHETPDFIGALRRFVEAAGDRVGSMDIDNLADLAATARVVDEVTGKAARALTTPRQDGQRVYSWSNIGAAVGTDRRSAWDKYHDPAGVRRKR